MQRLDETDLVHVLRGVGHQLAHPRAATPVLRPFPRAGHQFILRGIENAADLVLEISDAVGDGLAVKFVQLGLVVEQVHARRRAVLEEPQHALGLRREMRLARRERVHQINAPVLREILRARGIGEQRGERERPGPATGAEEELAAGAGG